MATVLLQIEMHW